MVKINFRWMLISLGLLSGCAEEQVIEDTEVPVIVMPQKPPRKPHRPVKPQVTAPVSPGKSDVFVVKSGDTLYSIGFGAGMGYELLSKWNNIPKPYRLTVGQVVKLYDPTLKNSASVAKANPPQHTIQPTKIISQPAPPPAAIQPPEKVLKPNSTIITAVAPPKPPAIPAAKPPETAVVKSDKTPIVEEEIPQNSKDKEKQLKSYWKWPVQGRILKSFVQSGNKGIDIEAQSGDPVQAAASGEVVYSGNGLIGYGNLLIVKHDDLYLSAYANNASLQVAEGQKVTQGQIIAKCGKSASGIPSLHFEIRKNGKSVNPMNYLPAP